jgi:micrococcal nuclease
MVPSGGFGSRIGKIPLSSFLLLALSAFLLVESGHGTAAPSRQDARVVAVNDGDSVTIVMNGMKYRARLIGIDAPEMGQEPWGRKAREHLRTLLKGYRWRVSIEEDVEQRDKYNRFLVYLWSPDGEMLNERMLRDGYAVLFTIQPNSKYAERFRKAQRSARENKKGIWGPEGLKERPLDYKKTHPRN